MILVRQAFRHIFRNCGFYVDVHDEPRVHVACGLIIGRCTVGVPHRTDSRLGRALCCLMIVGISDAHKIKELCIFGSGLLLLLILLLLLLLLRPTRRQRGDETFVVLPPSRATARTSRAWPWSGLGQLQAPPQHIAPIVSAS